MAEITVKLPDGSNISISEGSTIEDVAYEIGEGLGDDCVAGYVDDRLVGSEYRLEDGKDVRIITKDSDGYLEALRHTTAHVLAQAITRLYDNPKLSIGPPTDEGFYYDIGNVDLDESDLPEIEDEMKRIIEDDLEVKRKELERSEAIDYYEDNSYKQDIIYTEASNEETLSFYQQGEFMDLCLGGHVSSTGDIKAFELLEISAAYWRGDESNEMLTRIYGTAFDSDEKLEEFLEERRKQEERNHRRIGTQMNLFQFPDHTPSVQYLPKGMSVISRIKSYVRNRNDQMGYEEVWTPELNTTDLFKKSGHYEAFCSDGEMFYWTQSGTEYSLKPMNCGNHASMFSEMVESYADLPVRFSEFGTVYRHERSGSGSGLFRARGFTQDDGHAFVRPDQLENEVYKTMSVINDVVEDFQLDAKYKLETKPDDALGEDEVWENATNALKSALAKTDTEYTVNDGEGAFYGPKIGVDVSDVFGREWTLGTVQVDFNIPQQMDLTYTDRDNKNQHPIMIHRALIGSFERFLAILIEQYNGVLPSWLAPENVRILPISEDQLDYAGSIQSELSEFKTEIDGTDDTLERKIRRAHDERVPYMVIVGEKEEENSTISIRDADENEVNGIEISEFSSALDSEISDKSVSLTVIDKL